MCPPAAAAIASALIGVAGSKYIADQQNAKAEARMKRQQKEARERAAAERNAQEQNTLSEATPLLIKRGGKSKKGLSQLKVPGSSTSGYNALGMGGENATGLNIANV